MFIFFACAALAESLEFTLITIKRSVSNESMDVDENDDDGVPNISLPRCPLPVPMYLDEDLASPSWYAQGNISDEDSFRQVPINPNSPLGLWGDDPPGSKTLHVLKLDLEMTLNLTSRQ